MDAQQDNLLPTAEQIIGLHERLLDLARLAGRRSGHWLVYQGNPSLIGTLARDRMIDACPAAAAQLRELLLRLARVRGRQRRAELALSMAEYELRRAERQTKPEDPNEAFHLNAAHESARAEYEACTKDYEDVRAQARRLATSAQDSAWNLYEFVHDRHAAKSRANRKVSRVLVDSVRQMIDYSLRSRLECQVAAELVIRADADMRPPISELEQLQARLHRLPIYKPALLGSGPEAGRSIGPWRDESWLELLLSIAAHVRYAARVVDEAVLAKAIESLQSVDPVQLAIEMRTEIARALSGGGVAATPPATPSANLVLATQLVRENQRGRHNTKAVKNFAKQNAVPMRERPQRCHIDADAFEQAWQRRERAALARLDDIEQAKHEARRKKQGERRQ